jgi:predicted RecA/RadA family phage recombinase
MSMLHRRATIDNNPFGMPPKTVAEVEKQAEERALASLKAERRGKLMGGVRNSVAAAAAVFLVGAALTNEPAEDTGEEFTEGYIHNLEEAQGAQIAREALIYQDCMKKIEGKSKDTYAAVNHCLNQATNAPTTAVLGNIGTDENDSDNANGTDSTANATAAHQIEE